MRAFADGDVLFRAAAGPRTGFGHVVRCRALARVLGVRPVVALRGGPRTRDAVRRMGCEVLAGAAGRLLDRQGPRVLVVDDPVAMAARPWIAAGRQRGCFVVTVHDLGIGCREGDLVVDGSLADGRVGSGRDRGRAGRRVLRGVRFAILDPRLGRVAARGSRTSRPGDRANASVRAAVHRRAPARNRVLIALGGGPRVALAERIALAILEGRPDTEIRIAAGFLAAQPVARRATGTGAAHRITWLAPGDGLRDELARATVAIVGGGVLLYEACALGVPAIAVPVVAAQEPTVRAFASHRAACGMRHPSDPAAVSAATVTLLCRPVRRRRLSRQAQALVDARGAHRVARAIVEASR